MVGSRFIKSFFILQVVFLPLLPSTFAAEGIKLGMEQNLELRAVSSGYDVAQAQETKPGSEGGHDTMSSKVMGEHGQ